MYVICLFNFLGVLRIAEKIKAIDLGHGNILDYFIQNQPSLMWPSVLILRVNLCFL